MSDKTHSQTPDPHGPLIPGHAYDGIQEYDNPLPFWWTAIFWITIIFSAGYWVWYHAGGPGISEHEEYAAEMKVYNDQQTQLALSAPAPTEESLAAIAADPANIAVGKAAYTAKCVACHAAEGQGLVGPNLTDNYWIHGQGTLVDIHKVVADGVPEKGMISWKAMMSPKELQSVVAYVKTLQGTTPANPKAPQGHAIGGAPTLDAAATATGQAATATPQAAPAPGGDAAPAKPAGQAG